MAERSWPKCLGLLFLTISLLFLVGCGDKEDGAGDESHSVKTVNIALVSQTVNALRNSIDRVKKLNGLEDHEITKIDFSHPNDPSYGDNPKFEVFNSQGGRADPAWMTLSQKDWATVVGKDAKFLITLSNSIANAGSEQSDLVAIITGINSDACNGLNRFLNIDAVSEQEIELEPFPAEPLSDSINVLPQDSACIKYNENLIYYELLAAR